MTFGSFDKILLKRNSPGRVQLHTMIASFSTNPGSLILGLVLAGTAGVTAADFNTQVRPVFEANCIACHKPDKAEGKLDMTTLAAILKGSSSGDVLTSGDPDDSYLLKSMLLPADDDDLMPPPKNGGPLPKEITDVVKNWIADGAKWPEGVVLEQRQRVDFVEDIRPILELNCVSCHRNGNADGGFRMDLKEQAFTSGDNAPNLIPFNAEKSAVHFLTILDKDDDDLMPPANKGGPLPKEQTDLLRMWIEQGAPWPDGIELVPRKAEVAYTGSETDKVKAIYERITATGGPTAPDDMQPYTHTIPGSEVNYEMLPIPAGEFTMGSPESETGRKPDEGPQIKVKLEPFWMGKTEVTWNEFELFMYPHQEKMIRELKQLDPTLNALTDVQARPTAPYVEMSFGMGKDGYPAISMTQHAANKYCQWLSAKTGHFYRLPTEAEWEYACRAGTTSAFNLGGDGLSARDANIDDGSAEARFALAPAGTVGAANAWGLRDMHGNVWEWCADWSAPYPSGDLTDPRGPDEAQVGRLDLAMRVVRGGGWNAPASDARSANRWEYSPAVGTAYIGLRLAMLPELTTP